MCYNFVVIHWSGQYQSENHLVIEYILENTEISDFSMSIV